MSVENPGGKRWWRGGYVCECQTLIIPIMEQRMIDAGLIKESFDFFQYCYNAGGVAASAGTHDYGGADDHDQRSDSMLRIMRECGGAAWERTPAEGFDYHCHMILCGCPHLSSGAADQVNDYRNGRNGLANNGPDTGPDVPYITWQDAYRKYVDQVDEGILGMSDLVREHCTNDRVIKPDGEWWLVLINNDGDSTFFTGPGTFVAEAFIEVVDLPPGNDPLRIRFARCKENGDIDSFYPQQEIFGSEGTSFGHTSLINWLPDDIKLRLFVQAPHQVKITDVTANCIHDSK